MYVLQELDALDGLCLRYGTLVSTISITSPARERHAAATREADFPRDEQSKRWSQTFGTTLGATEAYLATGITIMRKITGSCMYIRYLP